jgi:uracil-DNA glycosylase
MSELKEVKIGESWKTALAAEFVQPYFAAIKQFLVAERAAGKVIYPPAAMIFAPYDTVALQDVKVVVIGQDPYINEGEAHGHSFSVPLGMKVPPSLRNIYKELSSDVTGFVIPKHGNLEHWAAQGVFLINATLTVEAKKANSHKDIGWQKFTDATIRAISEQSDKVVFMLWGKFAQGKAALIDKDKHCVLMAAHPSPLAGDAFLGSKHFSQANAYLEAHSRKAIDWILPV